MRCLNQLGEWGSVAQLSADTHDAFEYKRAARKKRADSNSKERNVELSEPDFSR